MFDLTSRVWLAEAYKLQASNETAAALPPTHSATAHHNKLISASMPEQADVALEEDTVAPADAAAMQAAVPNPLRQKASLLVGRETAEDDDTQAAARDMIPSLPKVSYDAGGMSQGVTHFDSITHACCVYKQHVRVSNTQLCQPSMCCLHVMLS